MGPHFLPKGKGTKIHQTPPREALYSVISFHPHTSFLSYGGGNSDPKRSREFHGVTQKKWRCWAWNRGRLWDPKLQLDLGPTLPWRAVCSLPGQRQPGRAGQVGQQEARAPDSATPRLCDLGLQCSLLQSGLTTPALSALQEVWGTDGCEKAL